MAFVECRALTRTYHRGEQEITPLRDLDLDIDSGEFVALMGPSGSGKTTLLNILAGIDRATSGTLRVGEVDLDNLRRSELASWRSKTMGYVFQLYHLMPMLTAYENVELPLLLHNLSRAETHRRVSLALDLVGLSDRSDHFPRQLSGGQEQRVAIARAIVTDPQLILADEPTGDLDSESADAILALLSRLHRDLGKTLVMVTHDPRSADVAERTVRLEKGRIVESAPSEQLRDCAQDDSATQRKESPS